MMVSVLQQNIIIIIIIIIIIYDGQGSLVAAKTEIIFTRCVSHTVYLAHRSSKGEGRGRSRYKNNS